MRVDGLRTRILWHADASGFVQLRGLAQRFFWDKRPQPLTLIINSGTPPQISTPTLPLATVGKAYSDTLAATGGAGGYRWSLLTNLPDGGLALSGSGTIRGTSTVPNDCYTGPGVWLGSQPPFGTFPEQSFQVQVTDASGQSASKALCLPAYYPTPQAVSAAPSTISFTGPPQTITVTGTNFQPNAAVYVQSKGFVATTYVNPTTLTFSITPGYLTYPPSTYTLWVVQPYSQVGNMNTTVTVQ